MATDRLSVGTSSPTATFWLQADEVSVDVPNNRSLVRAYLRMNAPSSSSFYNWHDASVSGSTGGSGYGISGASTDYATGSHGWGTVGPWDVWVPHASDGTGSASLGLSVSYPHASGTGGSTSGSLALTTILRAPSAPSLTSAFQHGTTTADLVWTAATAPAGVPVTGYSVQWATNSGFTGATAVSTGSTGTSYTLTGLPTNSQIWVEVSAQNAGTAAGAVAPQSNVLTFKTLAGLNVEQSGAWTAASVNAEVNGVWVPCDVFVERSGAWTALHP